MVLTCDLRPSVLVVVGFNLEIHMPQPTKFQQNRAVCSLFFDDSFGMIL